MLTELLQRNLHIQISAQCRNELLHLPFSTGVQQDYTQCSLPFLHAEHDPLHTDTVFSSVRLRSIDGHQVIPSRMLITMARIVEKACRENTHLISAAITKVLQ